jgi:hypothetical protein
MIILCYFRYSGEYCYSGEYDYHVLLSILRYILSSCVPLLLKWLWFIPVFFCSLKWIWIISVFLCYSSEYESYLCSFSTQVSLTSEAYRRRYAEVIMIIMWYHSVLLWRLWLSCVSCVIRCEFTYYFRYSGYLTKLLFEVYQRRYVEANMIIMWYHSVFLWLVFLWLVFLWLVMLWWCFGCSGGSGDSEGTRRGTYDITYNSIVGW